MIAPLIVMMMLMLIWHTRFSHALFDALVFFPRLVHKSHPGSLGWGYYIVPVEDPAFAPVQLQRKKMLKNDNII